MSANIDSASVVLHGSPTTPIASLTIPSGKSQTTSSSTSAKEFLTRRVRSRSKTDTQPVPDKSLFSKIFSKKSKKPLGTLITTTTNSIDFNSDTKRTYLTNKSSLTNEEAHSTIDEYEEEYGDDDTLEQSVLSAGSMSDIDNRSKKKSRPRLDPIKLPQSDSQYYASMSSAPKGFSISYHKRMTKGNDNIRLQQTAFGRPPKGNGTGGGDGANQLKVCSIRRRSYLSFSSTLAGSFVLSNWSESNHATLIFHRRKKKKKDGNEEKRRKIFAHLLACQLLLKLL